MFSILRDKISQGIKDIAKTISEKSLDDPDISKTLMEFQMTLIEGDVAFETSQKICDSLKAAMKGRQFSRIGAEAQIKDFFRNELLSILDNGQVNIEELASNEKPFLIVFLGFNGAGKTTNISKLASLLKQSGLSLVFAAADTYRAASIEQLEIHAQRLGVPVIKQKYGSDSAAVIYDAKQYAKAKGIDVVLADTAGRTHSNANLMDELSKIIRVNKPNLKVLVVDSLAGNDALEQAKAFHASVGVDCVILTKMDVNEKGGAALSISHSIGKPIAFVGTGQNYGDLKPFDGQNFVKKLVP